MDLAMPHEQMSEQQVAAYLKMDLREVQKLASRGQLPCRKVGGKFVFGKSDVDHWVESRMHTLDRKRLGAIEQGVSEHHGFDSEAMLLSDLIPPGGLAVPLDARTRDAVIRGLVDLAQAADLVHDRDRLIDEIRRREELCTTALVPEVALPHPRHPLPGDIEASFVVAGLAPSGIPYGSPDGSLTRLFFLICCKDDRTHLHVLARLGQVLDDPRVVERLLSASSAEELWALIVAQEKSAVERR